MKYRQSPVCGGWLPRGRKLFPQGMEEPRSKSHHNHVSLRDRLGALVASPSEARSLSAYGHITPTQIVWPLWEQGPQHMLATLWALDTNVSDK